MIDVSIFQKYADFGISVVPVRGKVPAISKWQNFSMRTPDSEEIDMWSSLSGVTGMGLVLGPASGLCAVDIDVENNETLLRKLIEEVPHSCCGKVGKKGVTYIYRSPGVAPKFGNKHQIKDSKGNVIADLLFSNSHVVIPPSMYLDKNGSHLPQFDYKWTGSPLNPDSDLDDLPEIDLDYVRRSFEMIISGRNLDDTTKCQPMDSVGRHNRMVKEASRLIRNKADVNEAVMELLKIDDDEYASHPEGKYFLDKSKGHKTDSASINAYKFYCDNLVYVNAKKTLNETLEEPVPTGGTTRQFAMLDGWKDPLPLKKQIIQPKFNPSMIPDIWSDWIMKGARVTGISPQSIFFFALSSLSALIGNKINIAAKHKDKAWVEAANIWIILLAKSGRKKSQALKIATHALSRIQKNIDEEHKLSSAKSIQTNEIIEIKIKNLMARLHEAVKAGESQNFIDEIQNEKSDLEKQLREEVCPTLVVNVATPEKLMDIFKANKTGTLLVENELGGLMSRMSKSGYESLRSLLMDSWDGNRPRHYDTKMHGRVTIDKLCGSLIANAQPSVMSNIMNDLMRGCNDDGFLQRSILVFDDEDYKAVVDEPFDLDFYGYAYEPFYNAHMFKDNEQKCTTTDAAYAVLMEFLNDVEDNITKEEIDMLSSFWGKMRGNVVKMAFLFEYLNNGGRELPATIDVRAMNMAIEAIKFSKSALLYHFNGLTKTVSTVEQAALKLFELIKSGIVDNNTSIRDINKNYIKDLTLLNEAIYFLIERNYIRIKRLDRTKRIEINPMIPVD